MKWCEAFVFKPGNLFLNKRDDELVFAGLRWSLDVGNAADCLVWFDLVAWQGCPFAVVHGILTVGSQPMVGKINGEL